MVYTEKETALYLHSVLTCTFWNGCSESGVFLFKRTDLGWVGASGVGGRLWKGSAGVGARGWGGGGVGEGAGNESGSQQKVYNLSALCP